MNAQERRRARRAQARATERARKVSQEQATELAALALVAAASGLALGERDEKWDSGAAVKSYELPADADCFMWKDPDGDPAVKGSYKLPFVSKDGGKHAVWGAITAIAGVLQGAQGGVDIPDADKAKVRSKVEGYYRDAAKKYGDDKIKAPWLADEAAAEVEQFVGNNNDTPGDTDVCAACDHPGGMHAGEANMGACSVADCDCAGYTFESAAQTDEFAAGDEPVLPDAHKPQSRIPRRHPSPRLPDVTRVPTRDGQAGKAQWTATLAPEGRLTDDGRAFAPDSISWRDLPLTLMGLTGTSAEGGHDGAEVAGRIDQIWREGGLIKASGIFDTSEFGQEISRMVGDGTLRGVSVDLAIHKYDFGPKTDWFNADGEWAPVEQSDDDAPSMIDLLFGDQDEDMIFVVTDATIGMATACPFQAFADATIEPASSLVAAPHDAMWTVTQQAAWTVVLKFDPAMLQEMSASGDMLEACSGQDQLTALPVGVNSLRAAAQVIAELAMTLPVQMELSLIQSAASVEELSLASADNTTECKSALNASLNAIEDLLASAMPISTPRGRGPISEQPRKPKNDGRKRITGERSFAQEHSVATPGSTFDGMNSNDSWSSKDIAVPSVLNPSTTNLGEAQSRIHTLTTSQGQRLFADGSVVRAIEVLAASATILNDSNEQQLTFDAPVSPPKEWFTREGESPVAPLTVSDEGRVSGYAATWNQCHVAFPDQCVTAPHSKTDYAYYLMGEVVCDDGSRVATGTVTLGTGHAGPGLGMTAATAHYDHTGTGVADVVVGEDEHGIWVAGALRPSLSTATVRELRAAKLSGDWRNVDGNLELCALLAVNVPGFPIPRPRASIEASGGTEVIVSLTAAGVMVEPDELREQMQALRLKADGEFDTLAAAVEE